MRVLTAHFTTTLNKIMTTSKFVYNNYKRYSSSPKKIRGLIVFIISYFRNQKRIC